VSASGLQAESSRLSDVEKEESVSKWALKYFHMGASAIRLSEIRWKARYHQAVSDFASSLLMLIRPQSGCWRQRRTVPLQT